MEVITTAQALAVRDSSMTGEARRAASQIAAAAGFDETGCGAVAIAATELATNLFRHAGGGTLIAMPSGEGGVALVALDKGPGMSNVQRCLEDGYSSAGSAGTGLGAVRRLATFFDVYSMPGRGTVVYAAFGNSGPNPLTPAAICTAKTGERVSGDNWAHRLYGGREWILVCDGLGHGITAAEASRAAVAVFMESRLEGAGAVVAQLHAALRATRGAAVAVAEIDRAARVVRYSGLGNISAAIAGPTAVRHMVSHSGTAGHNAHRIAEFSYDWPGGSVLVMCTDGFSTHWTLERDREVFRHSAGVIAGLLYRDFARGRDDATVIVAAERV